MRPLVWFRADLRVGDNPALHLACGGATKGVVAVFVVCPDQWRQHDWAPAKVDFILRCLRELSGELERLNVPLLIAQTATFDDVPGLLLDQARKHDCDALFMNRQYEIDEARRDEAVRSAFEAAGLEVVASHDQTVIPPCALRTKQDGFYTVFTPFKRTWLERLRRDGRPEVLGRPKRLAERVGPPDEVPESVEGFRPEPDLSELWPAGEKAARKRLEAFLENRVRTYAKQRDLPGVEGTSRLSPYLTSGVISARQCLDAAVAANNDRLNGSRTGPAVWIGELVWREFYRHCLVGVPRVSMNRPYRLETDRLKWRRSEKDLDAWAEGRTGVPIVDAAMRQLKETGWMHNRLRMITAMFLTKDLFLDWRLGERHFMRHLIDGDLASNNGGWQWSASTGADAAPYFRVFNPYRQSERFDPDGEFIRRFVPELRDASNEEIHDPPDDVRAEHDYPPAMVDHAEAARQAVAAFKRLK